MMYQNNIKRLLNNAGVTLPYFNQYNISRVFTMYKTSIHTLDYAMYIYTSSDVADRRYLFWDSNGLISLDSKVSTTTTPTTTSLVDFITAKSVSNVYAHTLYLSDGSSVSLSGFTGTSSPFYFNDVLLDYIDLAGDTNSIFKGNAFDELDEGNDWSMYIECASHDTNSLRGVFSSIEPGGGSGARFTIYVDRGSSKYLDIIRNTSTDNFFGKYLVSQNNSNLRLIGATVNGTIKEKKSYLNGDLQDTETYTGTYDNTAAVIGAILGDGIPLDGPLKTIIVCDAANTPAEVNNINTLITS